MPAAVVELHAAVPAVLLRSKGTDNRSKGTDNRTKGTDKLHVAVPRQPVVVVRMRERLLERGTIELGKAAGHAAEVLARLEHE